MELMGARALVTGGGKGIGLAVSRALVEAGARVAAVGRDSAALDEAKASLGDRADRFIAIAENLASEGAADRIADRAMAELDGVDILINNAGILRMGMVSEVASEECWDDTMLINLKAPFLLARRLMGQMRGRGEGYIINVSSTVALGVPAALASYGVSKHGLRGLSEALWEELRGSGVKVSSIYPGITDTGMVRAINGGDPGEWMQPEDIAACVIFLLSLGPRVIVKDIVPWAVGRDRI
jgi:NAD(P)-dependent dehydrogenase (short-subunit alcohol dehydrogenase family)